MRPVQLELTNFGPYRKEVINFTQFDHAPLFLIGGDTGAGKSTLFDAILLGFVVSQYLAVPSIPFLPISLLINGSKR